MRRIKYFAGFTGVVGLLTVLGTFLWLRTSLPQIDGEITIDGPSGTITIARDGHGVPHISADNVFDLNFGLGFVHAQDRLWQMSMNQRIGHGTLSEIAGTATLETDKYIRTLGFAHKARSAYDHIPLGVQKQLQAYADGVNAFIRTQSGALPPEFLLTGTRPTLWTPIDTLVWQKVMWLDLSGNMRSEIARARLLTRLTPSQLGDLYPPYPGDAEDPFPDMTSLYDELDVPALARVVGDEPPEGVGSNNWVVAGHKTASGKPLLANDPHLGLTTPSIWYLARLHDKSSGKNTVGVTFPGSPAVILGRNDKMAWGFTNTAPDIQDTFIEKLIDEDTYLTPDGPARFKTRTEVLKVKDAEDVLFTVRETRHGPVISDASASASGFLRDRYVLSLQWTALNDIDTSLMTFIDLPHSESFDDFVAAGHNYMGPEQNMIYADTQGNIGYHAPARIPVRHPDNKINGRLPSPGWMTVYDWQGYVPVSDLPKRYNPEVGIIATANEKVVGPDYPYYITRDWSLPYRGNRIRAQLDAGGPHNAESFKQLHFDTVSDQARDILPSIRAALAGNPDLSAYLGTWEGEMDKNRPEPLVFHTFQRLYQGKLISDELGPLASDFTRLRPELVKSSLYWSVAEKPDNDAYFHLPVLARERALRWCDDTRTDDKTETCTDLAVEAMQETISLLSAKHGKDWTKWQWGDEHILHQTHRPFSQVPALAGYFELSTPTDGSRYTVNVAGVSTKPKTLNQSTFGPSYRGIFDLSDLDKSLYIQPTGQSGNPLSDRYDDLFPLWQAGEYITIPTDRLIPQGNIGVLTIKPKKD